MKPTALAESLVPAFGPNPPKDIHIYVSIALCYLSEHCYEARTESGMRLSDLADMKCWLAEVAAAMNLCGYPASTEVSSQAETRTSLRVTGRSQPSRFVDPTCPRCGHVHQGESQCGEDMGGAGICRCELEVPA